MKDKHFRCNNIKGFLIFVLACAQEMDTLFVNEFSNASLRTLKAGDEKAISIRNNWHSCEFDSTHSWYFGCSDSRLSSRLRLDTMMNLFTLKKGDFYLNLKVRNCSCIHVRLVPFAGKSGGTPYDGIYGEALLRGTFVSLQVYIRG